MAKRSDGQFARRKNDLYSTFDHRAVKALLPHLPVSCTYVEPCAGDGALIRQLDRFGHQCVGAIDIEPPSHGEITPVPSLYGSMTIGQGDARTFDVAKHYADPDLFITNPPWTREILHDIIFNLYWQRPTWLLFDADWAYTQQARPYMPLCRMIVSVGRLKWIEDSKHDGKDNCAWYLFAPGAGTEFIGRKP